jgi:hypothetical protein
LPQSAKCPSLSTTSKVLRPIITQSMLDKNSLKP